MRFPVARERVRVQDRIGTFLVLSVDRAAGVADVIPIAGGRVEERIPLSTILPLTADPAKHQPNPPAAE